VRSLIGMSVFAIDLYFASRAFQPGDIGLGGFVRAGIGA
jgi:hypothetical protein